MSRFTFLVAYMLKSHIPFFVYNGYNEQIRPVLSMFVITEFECTLLYVQFIQKIEVQAALAIRGFAMRR